MTNWFLRLTTLGLFLLLIAVTPARAEELDPKHQKAAEKGLTWLVKQQFPDGHWEGQGGNFATAMTGLAGTCLLMEGSTIREGKYRAQIKKTVEWCIAHVNTNGLIGDPLAPNQGLGYLYGHGFCILFLSQVYGEEDDIDRRKQLEAILTKAVVYVGSAQTSRGGWGYVSAKEGNDFDEGSVTVTQIQALRAARNAGIPVPREIVVKTQEYLRKCTTARGGMIYSLANGGGDERPTITVAAIASMFSTGEYNSDLAKKWIKFVQPQVPINSVGADQFGHSEYTHYYYAQVIYCMGEDGYAKLFPDSKPDQRLTWSRYRKEFFEFLANKQNPDGSWTGTPIGQVYTTCMYLTVLQLDKGALPIYQR